ncbi:hypothetical protein K443DRAFT_673597 [Laccaria amethystina LaAM-08-1]|uniref:Uncharacterized protein n=1 Tax=Laccaria amethystina LaAM-08-1 TaxID=1095629 RepID=A0A0C9XQK4_9AGAR|nr:hypothetical protein K443DRAFT_673597 [Laccaria amethystina LaAM-08-1]
MRRVRVSSLRRKVGGHSGTISKHLQKGLERVRSFVESDIVLEDLPGMVKCKAVRNMVVDVENCCLS